MTAKLEDKLGNTLVDPLSAYGLCRDSVSHTEALQIAVSNRAKHYQTDCYHWRAACSIGSGRDEGHTDERTQERQANLRAERGLDGEQKAQQVANRSSVSGRYADTQ